MVRSRTLGGLSLFEGDADEGGCYELHNNNKRKATRCKALFGWSCERAKASQVCALPGIILDGQGYWRLPEIIVLGVEIHSLV